MGTQEGEGEKFFTEWEETYDSFDQMGLHENLLRGIYAYGEAIRQQQRPIATIMPKGMIPAATMA